MKIVIVGAGEVGYHIAKKLSEEKHEVVIIDKDPRKIRRIHENLDVQSLLGSGTSPKILRELGLDEADMLLQQRTATKSILFPVFLQEI